MSEFIPHEIQVAAVHRRGCHEAYHLVQCYAARDRAALIIRAKMPVHIGVYEPEYDRLVADECLVVAFGV